MMIRGSQLHGVEKWPVARRSSAGGSEATIASHSRPLALVAREIRKIASTNTPNNRYASHSALIDQAGPSQLDPSNNRWNQSCTSTTWRTELTALSWSATGDGT